MEDYNKSPPSWRGRGGEVQRNHRIAFFARPHPAAKPGEHMEEFCNTSRGGLRGIEGVRYAGNG